MNRPGGFHGVRISARLVPRLGTGDGKHQLESDNPMRRHDIDDVRLPDPRGRFLCDMRSEDRDRDFPFRFQSHPNCDTTRQRRVDSFPSIATVVKPSRTSNTDGYSFPTSPQTATKTERLDLKSSPSEVMNKHHSQRKLGAIWCTSQSNVFQEQNERPNQHRINTSLGGADQRAREGHNQTRSDPVVERTNTLTTVDVSRPSYCIIPSRNQLRNRPSGEIVQSSEEQTREHEEAIINLKRTRNSLLNISKLPPEVLGDIFHWNVVPCDDFWGWEVKSHNFLLVCHHWFEVASQTPELWSFWGVTLKEWKRYCHRSRTAPLDLVLDAYTVEGSFDITLRDALQDRAARNTIRRVHLKADSELLSSIISSLTVDNGVSQPNSVESLILINSSISCVDISDFFAHYYFPNLRHLKLIDYVTDRLGLLASRTGALTTLCLDSVLPSPGPATSELLSILASNPALQEVTLSVCADPSHSGNGSRLRVSLHNLKKLTLSGDVRDVVGVLHRLDHPNKLDLHLNLYNCAVGDISQVVRPYLRDYVGRRGTPQHGLGLCLSRDVDTIGHNIGDVGSLDPFISVFDRVAWFGSVDIYPNETLHQDLLEREILDLITHTPQEDITYFQVYEQLITMEAISTQFPDLRALCFSGTPLSAVLDLGGDGEIFPALQYVFLDRVLMYDYDWSPLTTSLTRRAVSGNRLDTLEISGSPHMCAEAEAQIRSVVRHFWTDDTEM